MTFRLLYRARANFPPFTYHDLEILRAASAANPKYDITGFLLRSPYEYFQILEGPQDRVEELAQRISLDGRIYDYRALWSGPVNGRLFGLWTMGFHMLGEGDNGLPHRLMGLTPNTPTHLRQSTIRDVAQLALEKYA